MDTSLSELSVIRAMDGGQTALNWRPQPLSGFLVGVDFDQILAAENPREFIQVLPPQTLYFSIKRAGINECLRVLPLLSQDQFTRILDYDIWHKGELSQQRFFTWLEALAAVGREEVARRFVDLEEEYQLSLCLGKFKVYNQEDYEELSAEEQDLFHPMPCGTVFYKIEAESLQEHETIAMLVDAIKDYDLKYAYAFLAHCAFMPPNESEQMLKQFRIARLEEDGFVSYEESSQIFDPFDSQPMRLKWAGLVVPPENALNVQDLEFSNFLDAVFDLASRSGISLDDQFAIHQGVLFLANSLCSASRIDADDVQGLNRLLQQIKSTIGLALETLSGGSIEGGLMVLQEEHPKNLFRFGLSLVEDLRIATLERFTQFGVRDVERLKQLNMSRKYGALVSLIDQWTTTIGQPMTEVMKGLFNRFPMYPSLFGGEGERQVEFHLVDRLEQFNNLKSLVNGFIGVQFYAVHHGLSQGDLEKTISGWFLDSLWSKLKGAESGDDKAEFLASQEGMREHIQEFLTDCRKFLDSSKGHWFIEGAQGVDSAVAFINDYVQGIMVVFQEGSHDQRIAYLRSLL